MYTSKRDENLPEEEENDNINECERGAAKDRILGDGLNERDAVTPSFGYLNLECRVKT